MDDRDLSTPPPVSVAHLLNRRRVCLAGMDRVSSGSTLALSDPRSEGCKVELLVERRGGSLVLARLKNPYSRIHINEGGVKLTEGSPHWSNLFSLVPGSEGANELFSLVVTAASRTGDPARYALALDEACNLHSVLYTYRCETDGHIVPGLSLCSVFKVAVVDPLGAASPLSQPRFEFEKWQLRRFVHEGYIHMEGVADSAAVENCLRLLNHELGVPGQVVAGGVQDGLGKLAGCLSNSPLVREVCRGAVGCIIDALGGGSGGSGGSGCAYEMHNLSAQIAYRFPELGAGAADLRAPIGEGRPAV
jgi:hypothetical protein